MIPFVIGLGSNQGDSVAILADAVTRLTAAEGVRVRAVSSLYRTAPVGGIEQDDFFNAVLVGETSLSPRALLALGQALERAQRRTREVRWGPRTLDIDILAFGDLVADDPGLTLPHPRAQQRAFVLVPWLEADPDAVLPGHGPVRDLAATVDAGGVWLDRSGEWWSADA